MKKIRVSDLIYDIIVDCWRCSSTLEIKVPPMLRKTLAYSVSTYFLKALFSYTVRREFYMFGGHFHSVPAAKTGIVSHWLILEVDSVCAIVVNSDESWQRLQYSISVNLHLKGRYTCRENYIIYRARRVAIFDDRCCIVRTFVGS